MATLADIALTAVRQEYPHWIGLEVQAGSEVPPPRQLSPAFYGCYDWHSAVHSHWLLVRALGRGLPGPLAGAVTQVLDEHLSAERLAAELSFFTGPAGLTNERPYGWAWLVMLHAECQAAPHGQGERWARALQPLARLLSARLRDYFGGQLQFPVRAGTHGNTAFSLRLLIAAARRRGDEQNAAELAAAARRMFGPPHVLAWDGDPSGDAFLSPELTEAALMAQVMTPAELAGWLGATLPGGNRVAWDPPRFATDAADPGTVHLEGLLVSRAWCLDALARALPAGDPVGAAARAAADAHVARVAFIEPGEGFGRSHWMPTFLLYLDEQLRQ